MLWRTIKQRGEIAAKGRLLQDGPVVRENLSGEMAH